MEILQSGIKYVATHTAIAPKSCLTVLKLLLQESCTVPFIARYRKDKTDGLDEVQIRDIEKSYEDFVALEKRREYVLDYLEKNQKLTPDLKSELLKATTLAQIEDIYAPFKTQRKTKALVAKERGLEPLADLLLQTTAPLATLLSQWTQRFLPGLLGDLNTLEEALAGASDILVERFSHAVDLKENLRQLYWSKGIIVSTKKELEKEKSSKTKSKSSSTSSSSSSDNDDHRESLENQTPDIDASEIQKFQDYFEYQESVQKLKESKSSHRFLAMRRGMKLGILKVEMALMAEEGQEMIRHIFFPKASSLSAIQELEKCAKKAMHYYIHPSLDLEIKGELKKIADQGAIDVFGQNLKNLLLAPYLGPKTVMGVDPGVRTGCKIAVVGPTGEFLFDHVVYPHPPKMQVQESASQLNIIIEKFRVEFIAVGNGTYGRETLSFLEENVISIKERTVSATMISEAGASIYSTSDIAREEFPDKDPTVRGAISIARRFQDPLAELVKIDPKSIGVGQYQHDVSPTHLKKSLLSVVESCVNYVGVDVNTASGPLLSYISGLSKTQASSIVTYRHTHGKFRSRQQLLQVPFVSQKVYEQAAGFLRIYAGENPLDATFVHPEIYPSLHQWCQQHQSSLALLVDEPQEQKKLEKDPSAAELFGARTLQDILTSLRAPSQDPRTIFKSIEFHKDLRNFADVKVGQWYTGVVSNITHFGAFVDIGIKESGLLHISEMSHQFIENALEHFKVGQEIKVKVISVDKDRRRIALSARADSKLESKGERPVATAAPAKTNAVPSSRNSASSQKSQNSQNSSKGSFGNKAFSGLKNIQLEQNKKNNKNKNKI